VLLAAVGALVLATVAPADSTPIRVDTRYSMIVRILDTDKYQLEVDNPNPTRSIDSFVWTPPSGMTLTGITGTQGGKCLIDSGTLNCHGKIAAPICMCISTDTMLVNFTATGREPTWANGFWIHYGVVGGFQITGSSPVQAPSFGDLPLCKKGQQSTKAHPCTKR
jgi:hypothetical protein